ncbi:MAG: hypothetical protein ACJAYU_002164 [Bradymonadia bacterium]
MGVGGYALFYGFNRTYIDDEAVLHGSLIGGTGLLFFCLWLRKAVSPIAAAMALVAVVSAAGGFGYFAFERSEVYTAQNVAQEQLFASISTVCTINEGLPGAPGYVQGGLSTAMFYNRRSDATEWYPSRYGTAEEYHPAAIEQLNIVICAATQTRFIESCPYSTYGGDRTLNRQQYVKTITVRDARSAAVLETQVMEGTMPSDCPGSRTFGEYEYTASSYGSLPNDSALIELIGSWLDGTASLAAAAHDPAANTPNINGGTGVKPGDEPSNGKP